MCLNFILINLDFFFFFATPCGTRIFPSQGSNLCPCIGSRES